MRLTEEQRQVLIQMEKIKGSRRSEKLEAQRKEQEAANAEKAAAQAQQTQPAQTAQTQPTQQNSKPRSEKAWSQLKTEPVKSLNLRKSRSGEGGTS